LAGGITGLQQDREFDSVHSWKHDVDDDKVRTPVFEHFQRMLGGVDGAGVVSAGRKITASVSAMIGSSSMMRILRAPGTAGMIPPKTCLADDS